jgi:hypothetical protein
MLYSFVKETSRCRKDHVHSFERDPNDSETHSGYNPGRHAQTGPSHRPEPNKLHCRKLRKLNQRTVVKQIASFDIAISRQTRDP